MKRRVLCWFMVFVLLTGMRVHAENDTEYLFKTAEAIADEALLSRVSVISQCENVYLTAFPAVLLALETSGQLVRWEADAEVSLLGLGEELSALEEEAWTNALLGVGYAEKHGITGEGIRIGMIDSGLWDGFQEKTGVKVAEGVNFLESEEEPERRADTADNHGHGTAVASVLASVAPGAELVPLKCFEGRTTKISMVTKAIYAAVDDYHCDILNLSLGIRNDDWSLSDAILYAYRNQVLITAASGNLTEGTASTGNDSEYYPAAYPEVISVGAVDRYRNVTAVSVQNDSIWITAPGQDIVACSRTGGSSVWSGTSLASPFAAGAAALALSADAALGADLTQAGGRPGFKTERFRSLLAETAEDLGVSGYDNAYGYGLLNIGLLLAVLEKDDMSIVATGDSDTYSVSAYVPEAESGYQVMLAQYAGDGRFLSAETVTTGTGRTVRNLPISDVTKEFTFLILENGTWRPLHSEVRYEPGEAPGGNDLPPIFMIPA